MAKSRHVSVVAGRQRCIAGPRDLAEVVDNQLSTPGYDPLTLRRLSHRHDVVDIDWSLRRNGTQRRHERGLRALLTCDKKHDTGMHHAVHYQCVPVYRRNHPRSPTQRDQGFQFWGTLLTPLDLEQANWAC